ncbi:MAG TPA: S53 family peptidase [Candidatus Saccharimonadales bacterium]|nr:S53 family peptidase [Candidatus Saccharimonadales bacterium]
MAPADSGSPPAPGGDPSPEPDPGSVVSGWSDLGPVDTGEEATITLVLWPRSDTTTPIPEDIGRIRPELRAHLSREQLATVRGADSVDVASLRDWCQGAGLELLAVAADRRTATVQGSLGRLGDLFGVELRRRMFGGREYRSVTGPISLPSDLAGRVVAVLGLDTRPMAAPHFRVRSAATPVRSAASSTTAGHPPPQVAELYSFPAGTTGAGECIGLIELGGGFRTADITAYFQQLQLPPPEVLAVSVDGAENQPTGALDGPDGEVMLDIEVAGSIAPGVRLAVYFAPNTDQGFLDAINAALHDNVNRPTVISISWGSAEANWAPATMLAFDQAFQDGALVGVTICVAAGDNGSGDGLQNGQANVDFPASSPHVLACGGTRLTSSGNLISTEVVWNDGPGGGATGGGVSAEFALPSWQAGAHVPPSADPGHKSGRGVPDVSGDADPESGYQVLVDGQSTVFGGTSAVAPLWAALLVRCAQALGRSLGYLNPILYQALEAEGVTRDITNGNNGAYKAGPGWDPCTGWGSPDGTKFLAGLRG